MLAICILIIGCCLSTHLAISLFSLFPQIDPLLPAFPFSFNAITVSPATPREAHQNCLGLSHLLHPPTFCWLPSLVEPFSKRPHHPRLSPGLPSVWLFQFYLNVPFFFGALLSLLCPLSKQFSTAIRCHVFLLSQRFNYIASLLNNWKQRFVAYRTKHKTFVGNSKHCTTRPLYCIPVSPPVTPQTSAVCFSRATVFPLHTRKPRSSEPFYNGMMAFM